jgi:hypothetical protein
MQQAWADFGQSLRELAHVLLHDLACKTCEFRHNWPDMTPCDRCVWYDDYEQEA